MFKTVIASILTSLLGSGGLTWFLQKRIEHKHDEKIKRLESELAQQNFRVSHVFETTEKTIAEVYAKLLLVLDAAEDHTMLINDSDKEKRTERVRVLNARFFDFYNYYRPRKIYIPKETRIGIDELAKAIIKLIKSHDMSAYVSGMNSTSDAAQKIIEKHDKRIEELQLQIPQLLKSLEDDFQRILGFPVQNEDGSVKSSMPLP